MASGQPNLTRQMVLGAAAETTAGTAVSVSASDAAENIYNATLEEIIPETIREAPGTMDTEASVPQGRLGRLRFSTWIYGGASDPLWATVYLPACGWVGTSRVYVPVSGSATAATLTMYLYEDGLRRGIAGAVGTWKATFLAGQCSYIEWEFLGRLLDDADVSLPVPTLPTTIPPRWAGAAFTVGSFAPLASRMTIDAGNTLEPREDPSNDAGYIAAVVTNRRARMTIDPEATLVATQSWLAKLKASTQEALSAPVGTVANNIVTFAAPKAQVVDKKRGNRRLINTNELEFNLGRSTGDDSLTITFA